MISVIIINYNTSNILNLCIESIYKYNSNIIFEIIIIDNASNENERFKIHDIIKSYSNIVYIQLNNKIHFSAANNIGIKTSKYDFILIMNPDIIFFEPVLEKLLKNFDNETGAVTPALIGQNGIFQRNYYQRYPSIRQYIYYQSIFAKFFEKSQKLRNKYLNNNEIDINSNNTYLVEQIPGAFFLTKKNILKEFNYLDENFELFFEDVDLSYRISSKYKLKVVTNAKVIHVGGSSFNIKENIHIYGIFIISMLYFFKKNYKNEKVALLKLLVKINSYFIIILEYFKKILGKQNSYRLNKHFYLIYKLKKSND